MRLAAAEDGVVDVSSDCCIVISAEKIILSALCWQCNYVGIVS